jgi:ATP-binding cassette subfamily B protein
MTEKPKSFGSTLSRLWKYFGNERKYLAVIFSCAAVSTAIGLLVPWLIGHAIDAISSHRAPSEVRTIILVILSVYVVDAFLSVTQGWFMAGVSQRIVRELRKSLFAKFQKLPVSFFDTRTHGEVMSRVTNDIDNISITISQSTTQLVAGVFMIAGSFVMMLILSPLLTCAALVMIPLVFILTRTVTRKTRKLFREQQKRLGALNSHIEESISGISVVRAFGREEKIIERFAEINGGLLSVGIKAQIWSGYIMPMMNVINNIGFVAVAGVGGALAVNHLITVGVIASFLGYSRQFSRPLNELANTFNTLQTALAGAERVFEVMDEPEEEPDREGAVELVKPRGHVVFDNVSFGYRPDNVILKEVSFESGAGSSTALVGPTGAGKTTIVNLLARFYDVSEGTILIDGRDICDYTRDSLRRAFGIVLQDTYLFSGSIRDNIKYGRPDATDDEMIRAAETANAHRFIMRLKSGYDTELSESGSNLSHGQRQLIAIARAILSDPSILILDEATSSVDTRTEFMIQKAMLGLMEGRTSYIIAHRLSTIRDADRIMVIDDGRIVEKGTHRELLEKTGVYSSMYRSQFDNTSPATEEE